MEYTLKNVVATLAMIETPSAAITVSPSEETDVKDVKEGLLESGPTITLVHQKPITSSIRGTIRHLVNEAGRFSRWRGFQYFLLYNVSFLFVGNLLEQVFMPRFPGSTLVASAITSALLVNLHAAWTHAVIAMPVKKSLKERIVSRSHWKPLAVAAATEAAVAYLAIYVMVGLGFLLGIQISIDNNGDRNTPVQWVSLVLRCLAVMAIAVSWVLFVILPASVTLIRVEASVLPEDEDTIVPFDRTFGGKVVSQMLGGTGVVGFLDAWKSFTWEARRRLLKLYVKYFVITVALYFIFIHVLLFEAWAIMGPALGKYASEMRHQGFPQ